MTAPPSPSTRPSPLGDAPAFTPLHHAITPAAESAAAAAGPVARRAGPARRVVEGLALLGIFGAAIELTVRIEDWVRFRTPLLSRITSARQLMVRDADGTHGRPNARFQQFSMNSLGLRGPEVAVAKAAGTIRVVTAGASESFGLFESPGREYPRQLEDSLRQWVAGGRCGAGARVEVLNASLAGMGLPTIEQDLRTRIARLRPDVVVVYPTPSFYLNHERPTAAPPDSSPNATALARINAFMPRAKDRFREQAKALLPSFARAALRRRETAREFAAHDATWAFRSVPADRMAAYTDDLHSIVATARATGATPVLVTHGNYHMQRGGANEDPHMLAGWQRYAPRATAATIVEFEEQAVGVTLAVAADAGIPAADLASALARAEGVVFRDFVHFSDTGAAIAAGTVRASVWDALVSRGVCTR